MDTIDPNIVQELSPLAVLQLKLRPYYEYDKYYPEIMVFTRQRKILFQFNRNEHCGVLYFQQKQDYIDFCNKFPWVLRGEDEG